MGRRSAAQKDKSPFVGTLWAVLETFVGPSQSVSGIATGMRLAYFSDCLGYLRFETIVSATQTG